jgi:hypothetical protein
LFEAQATHVPSARFWNPTKQASAVVAVAQRAAFGVQPFAEQEPAASSKNL